MPTLTQAAGNTWVAPVAPLLPSLLQPLFPSDTTSLPSHYNLISWLSLLTIESPSLHLGSHLSAVLPSTLLHSFPAHVVARLPTSAYCELSSQTWSSLLYHQTERWTQPHSSSFIELLLPLLFSVLPLSLCPGHHQTLLLWSTHKFHQFWHICSQQHIHW